MQLSKQNAKPDHLGALILYGIGSFIGVTVGAGFGAVCGFVSPAIYYKLTNQEVLKDGQWGMIYLKTVPESTTIGLIVGIAVGLIAASKLTRK